MREIADLQAVELDILKKFIQVVNAKNLRWFAMFGTLLGASRCGGFIPWDDDIDIVMPRDDYNELRKMANQFSYPYFLQTSSTDPAAAPRFIRLRRSDTTVITHLPNVYTKGGSMGAYIDIIPMDIVPDIKAAKKLQEVAQTIHQQMYYSAALDENAGENVPEFKEDACILGGGIAGQYSFFSERYENYCAKHKSGYYCSMPSLKGNRGHYVFDRKWFALTDEMDFEDIKIRVPSGWRDVLITCYPEGLNEPPIKYQKPKHLVNSIVDLSNPYTHYTKKYTDMLCDIDGKTVFFFGAGDSLRIWIERYGKNIDIACTFDNDSKKWGSIAHGVPVRDPSILPRILSDNGRLIITSIYHKEIGNQLNNMGITDYYVFLDGLQYKGN